MDDRSDLARRWVEAFADQRDDDLVALAHPDILLCARWGTGAGTYRGRAGVRHWLAAVGAPRPALALVSVEALGDGRVLTESLIEGITAIGVFEVEDGLIHDVAGYLSDRAMLETLGVIA